MKKFKKNLSRTIFASFFVFQFVVSTSFMPLTAIADETKSEESTKEEVSSFEEEVTKEESQNESEDVSLSEEISEDSVQAESNSEESIDATLGEESSNPSDSSKEENNESLQNEEVSFQEVGTNADLTVCKVLLNKEGEVVDGSEFSGSVFTIPFTFEGNEYSVVIDASEYASLKQTFGSEENQFDAMCKSVEVPVNLPINGLLPFEYGREQISGNFVWDDFYNEGDLQNGVLFDNGYPRFLPFGADESSDGQVADLTGNLQTGFSATIFVVNKLVSTGECDVPPVYARVNLENLANSVVSKKNTGWYNTGTGNMSPKVFVGGSVDLPNENGGNVYEIGEWFPLYDSLNGYINDPLLTSANPGVPGLAVQRLNGQVRVVLYGSHSQPAGQSLVNREMANGFIEFSNNQLTVSSDVSITGQIIDAQNPPEMNPNAPIDSDQNDYISFSSDRSNFKFIVSTHNDGMYTVYSHAVAPEDCGGGSTNTPPTISVNPASACISKSETSYNALMGVTAFDAEDGDITSDITAFDENVRFGVLGNYTILYSVTDSEGLAAGGSRTLYIKDDCGNGGGDDNKLPKITINIKDACYSTSVTEKTFNFFEGVSATDEEDGDITSSVIVTSHNIIFGSEGGPFTINYKVSDSDGATAIASRTIFIKEKCGGGGGSCDASINLVSNGSFENPEVGNSAGWDVYENGASGLVWTSEWNGFNPNTPAQIEIQENVSGWDAHTGDQYAELDSDQDGPGGGLNGEQASTTISQVIDTAPYQFYKVTYHFAARPGTPESDNRLGFYIDGELYDDVSASGMGLTQPYWQTRIFAFYAEGTQTTISFSDLGNPNSFGTFLDSVEVVCVDDEDPVNTPPKIVVVPDFVCIAVTQTAQSYAFLSGVSAYDAEDGSIVPTFTHNIIFGVEGGPFTITYTATDSEGVSATATRTVVIKENCGGGGGGDNDPVLTIPGEACIETNVNSFDFTSGVSATDDEGVDNVTITNNSVSAVAFGQVGTYVITYTATDSDGNTDVKTRTINIKEDCDNGGGGGGDDDLVIEIADACVERGTENFDILSGLSVKYLGGSVDINDESVEITTVSNPTLDVNTNGNYVVTYTVEYVSKTDSVDRTISVQDDCDNGGGGGGGGGGGSSSGSRRNSSDGEVLGAATCVAFTTYNRLGNAGGEIKALQTFLNLYMDAGLTVDGVYGRTTAQAVHDFQAFHWKEVIDPWTPPLSPNTTGWQYKTTRMTINAIIDCPEAAVYLEDPGVMYQVTTVEGEKDLTTAEMEEIYNLLALAQAGQVLGATDVNTNTNNTLDITDPNYDLMFGK